jgi:hypothetical protein
MKPAAKPARAPAISRILPQIARNSKRRARLASKGCHQNATSANDLPQV